MRFLRSLIICEDSELSARIQELLRESAQVEPTLTLQRYPERREAARHLNICRPEVILLAIDRLQTVLDFLRELESCMPDVPVICISRLQDPRALSELMRLGVRDCIAAPLNREKFLESIHRLVYQFKGEGGQRRSDPLISFLPARGGSGTSTLACNISALFAEMPDAHVLLADLDLSAGLSRFVFKLNPTCTLMDLVAGGAALDPLSWRQCILTAGPLDVVPGGGVNPRQTFTAAHMRQLMSYVCAKYRSIVVDLTGSMETYTMELLRRSRRIVLVSTTERPSLELAKEKLALLRGMELESKVSMALTLSPDAPQPDLATVQSLLGIRVEAMLDFTEKRVRKSLAEGDLVESKTTLGRQIEQFGRALKVHLE